MLGLIWKLCGHCRDLRPFILLFSVERKDDSAGLAQPSVARESGFAGRRDHMLKTQSVLGKTLSSGLSSQRTEWPLR